MFREQKWILRILGDKNNVLYLYIIYNCIICIMIIGILLNDILIMREVDGGKNFLQQKNKNEKK
jgi:hypothetical protein